MKIAALVLCVVTAGCATPAPMFDRVCGLQPLGQQQGIAFVRIVCPDREVQ